MTIASALFQGPRRAITAVATVFGITASLLLVAPTAAQADTATYRFTPIRLIAHDIEDWWDDTDEIRMYYGADGRVERSVRAGGTVWDMPSVTYTGNGIAVDLKEWDRGYDANNLGRAYIYSTDSGNESYYQFTGWGYHYELVYKVERA